MLTGKKKPRGQGKSVSLEASLKEWCVAPLRAAQAQEKLSRCLGINLGPGWRISGFSDLRSHPLVQNQLLPP